MQQTNEWTIEQAANAFHCLAALKKHLWRSFDEYCILDKQQVKNHTAINITCMHSIERCIIYCQIDANDDQRECEQITKRYEPKNIIINRHLSFVSIPKSEKTDERERENEWKNMFSHWKIHFKLDVTVNVWMNDHNTRCVSLSL